MSIIVTQITGRGIIHGADSNLTSHNDQPAGQAKKLFELPRHQAAVTVAGTYGVSGEKMDVWMSRFISNDSTNTLKEFSDSLANTINATNSDFTRVGYFFHLAGYQQSGGVWHPEFYHITNYTIDQVGGGYQLGQRTRLEVSEDFWSQNGQKSEDERFANHASYVYCNGYPSGRQAYFKLLIGMANYRSEVWGNTSWRFQAPTTVEVERKYLKNDMEHIGILFSDSNYAAPYIGGDIQTYAIPSP